MWCMLMRSKPPCHTPHGLCQRRSPWRVWRGEPPCMARRVADCTHYFKKGRLRVAPPCSSIGLDVLDLFFAFLALLVEFSSLLIIENCIYLDSSQKLYLADI